MAAPSERRASRLSAYYSRSAAPSPSPPPVSATRDERAPPELRGRDAALQYAAELSRSQPLDQLLSHATHARTHSETLHHAAHSSTRQHYAQLRAAIAAARSARQLAAHVLEAGNQSTPALTCLRGAAQRCGDVGASLERTRTRLARLDGVRVVQLLRSAAQLLTTQLPALHAELVLCTDPHTARDNMLTAARRFDAVRPAVQHLAKSDGDFAVVLKQLCASAQQVNEALRDEPVEALSTVECARVRLLLGEATHALRDHMLAEAASRISAMTLADAALSGDACERAAMYVRFGCAQIVPALEQVARDYEQVFAVNGELEWTPLVVWAAHVSDDAFVGEVSEQLRADVLQQRGSVQELRKAVEELAQRGAHDKSELSELMVSVSDTLRSTLVEAAVAQRDATLHKLVEVAMSGDDVDGMAVVECARQLAEKGEWFAQKWTTNELLVGWGRYAIDRAVVSSHAELARVARLCERVGNCAVGEGEVGAQLVAVHDMLIDRLVRALCEQADDLIVQRIEQLEATAAAAAAAAADEGAPKSGAASKIEEVLGVLRTARQIGQECAIESLVGGDAHEEVLRDEEHLGRCVARLFVQRVREVVVEEHSVRQLQMDAWRLRQFVGDGSFDEVSAALSERCVDEVRVLDSAQAAALYAE